jgi:hypothetical protein
MPGDLMPVYKDVIQPIARLVAKTAIGYER